MGLRVGSTIRSTSQPCSFPFEFNPFIRKHDFFGGDKVLIKDEEKAIYVII